MALKNLTQLVFSDLCVAQTVEASWYKETSDTLDVLPIPKELCAEVIALHKALCDTKKSSFVFCWPPESGVQNTANTTNTAKFTMRIQRMVTLVGTIYVCRRFVVKASNLLSLGFPASISQELLHPHLCDGLIVFCGKAGHGKTTAAYTFLKERLTTHGGVLWTLENPPEMMLSGRHGKGVCYQVEVANDTQMGTLTPMFLRATPNYVLYGEVRDASTLSHAIKLALSGHLVVITIHAGDIVTCISRMGEFLKQDAPLLAEALKAVIYLELHRLQNASSHMLPKDQKTTGDPPRVLNISPLFIAHDGSEIKSLLRDKAYHQLGNVIDKIKRRNMHSGQER